MAAPSPGAASRGAVGGVSASKMAAAAVTGTLGRAGWRLLQLRCLPGEGAAEPASGRIGEGARSLPGWVRGGRGRLGGPQGEVKGIGAEPPAPRA